MNQYRYRFLMLLAATLVPGQAYAQASTAPQTPLGGEPPTAGVRLHAPSLVSGDDASPLEISPGALGTLPSWSIVLHHSELRDGGRVQGRGTALFAAAPLPFYRPLVLGVGLQWLRPPDPIGYADSVKIDLGVAWRLTRWFSLGLTYHTFISDDDPALDALNTLDLGWVARPFEWLAAGFVLRNVTTPLYAGLQVQRLYGFELATRPLCTRRLEIGAGFQVGERRGDIDPYLRLVGEPIWGLRLFSQVELVRRDYYRTDAPISDVRASIGLSFTLEHIGFTSSTLLARKLSAGPGPLGESSSARSIYQGVSFSLNVGGARQHTVAVARRVVTLSLEGSLTQRNLIAMIELLDSARRLADVRGVLLRVDALQLGWAQAQELRRSIGRLREAGKQVYAFLQAPTAKEYYLVAGADRVLLEVGGGIQLQGIAAPTIYFRGLLDKLGIRPQFIKIAEYKSAIEPLTRRGPSDPAKQMRAALLDDVFAQLVRDLATDRKQPVSRMRAAIDVGYFTPRAALAAGLVDEVIEAELVDRRVQRVARASIVGSNVLERAPDRWPVGPAIAIVLIDGDIVHGPSATIPIVQYKVVGDRTIVEALTAARTNRQIKAIVLRIDSPGGSALASQRIWQAVKRASKTKPVVVSMSNAAASGGYYAAAGADRIFALPATLTGSIGIFTGKFDLSGLLAKLDVSSDLAARGKRATIDSVLRPYSAEERTFILSQLQYYYRGFLAAVGKNRGMTMDAVHHLARGRVWTGLQARGNKLIDAIGGLSDALDEAKRRARIDRDRPVRVALMPKPHKSLLARAIALVGDETNQASIVPASLRAQLTDLPAVLWYARSDEPLARLPYDVRY